MTIHEHHYLTQLNQEVCYGFVSSCIGWWVNPADDLSSQL